MSKMSKLIHQEAMKRLHAAPGPGVIIDVGAYQGGCSIEYAKLLDRQVYAIEACPRNAADLAKNAAGYLNITVEPIAIAGISGPIEFFVANHRKSKGTSQSNSLYRAYLADRQRPWAKPNAITVPGLTLSEFMDTRSINKAEFVKFNCEGGEYAIFSGDDLSFLDRIGMLSLSMHGKSDVFTSDEFLALRRQIVTALAVAGFEMVVGMNELDHRGHVDQLWVRSSK